MDQARPRDAFPAAAGVLDLLAYAARHAFDAEEVVIAVVGQSRLTVLGWSGPGPDARGCPLWWDDGIPVGAVRAAGLGWRADGSLQVTPAEESCAASGDAARALVLRSRPGAEPEVALVVVSAAADTGLGDGTDRDRDRDRAMWTLLDAAAEAVAARRRHRDRLRWGLQEREEERRRWARELHDETLQQMGALQVLLTSTLSRARTTGPGCAEVLGSLRTATELLGVQINGLRQLITELRPAALDELGLAAPLQALARRTEQATRLRVDVRSSLRYADGQVSTRLLPDIELAIYRVVQEALTNASRHAKASAVRVHVTELDDRVVVEVADDGAGIADLDSARGFGISGMEERAHLAGGHLEVLSPRGSGEAASTGGTVVRLVVPATHRSEGRRIPSSDSPGRADDAGEPPGYGRSAHPATGEP